MNRKFTFTLTKEEYLNFLRFQAAHSKRARRIRMWIAISLPVEDKILYKDKKEHSISYRDILRMIPANEVFIFQYKNQGTLLLPYRLFENKEDMTEFFKEFEMAWKPYR